ncbi:hypothetical protein EJ08DRAFT_487900 [Tothia fuscella]|uniref:Uncharacterized protein n=1 Tax=Tothia fuscella TaxID=1048955 RepID=A0A9P4NI48_9PEZI|nr:hypothetical protein EJ08DRAFT_487900 [Tothia fuscella]
MAHRTTDYVGVPAEASSFNRLASTFSTRRGVNGAKNHELESDPTSTLFPSANHPQNQHSGTLQPESPFYDETSAASKRSSRQYGAPNSVKPSPRSKFALNWWWWWEIGAALISIICILLIFATLVRMHDRPLSDWKLAISINATVSILTTVAKSALMLLVAQSISHLKWSHYESAHPLKDVQDFDDASRGPWGAIMFVFKVRGRAVLATGASLLVIISLGFEPAAQQMLSFPSRNVTLKDSSRAYMYRALGVNTTDLVAVHPGTKSTWFPPNPLQVALINSFGGVIDDAPLSCPTSLCQFGDFETLGVCEQCHDATPLIRHVRNFTGAGGGRGPDGQDSYKNWRDYFLPNDPFYPRIQINYTNHGAIDGAYDFAVSANFSSDNKDLSTRRAGFMAANMTDLLLGTVESTTICDFSWCTRKYFAAEVRNGEFHFAKESSSPLEITNSTGDGEYGAGDTTFILTSTDPGSTVQYKVDWMVDYVLWNYLAKSLSGNARSNSMVQMMSRNHFNTTAALMSQAITNWMRSLGNNGSTLYQGKALEPVTFVNVKWAWLVWPAMLTIAGSVLLVACILRGGNRTLFKSSPLALLFHGLHGFDEDELKAPRRRGVEGDETLEETARSLRVKFRPDENGVLKFVKQ